MKKTILLILLLLRAGIGFAQITFTQTDFPKAGDFWVKYSGSFLDTMTAPADSAQVWDYSKAFDINYISGLSFTSPQNLPPIPQLNPPNPSIPNDTLCGYDNYSSYFYKTDSTGLYYDCVYSYGFKDSIGEIETWDYPNTLRLLLPVPFAYGSTRTDTSYSDSLYNYWYSYETFENDCSGISIENFNADAYGTLTTPAFNKVEVIRLKVSHIISYDVRVRSGLGWIGTGSSPADSIISYLFLKKGTNCLAMQVDYNTTGEIIGASYYDNHFPTGITSINQQANSIQLYPNPSANNLFVSGYSSSSKELEVKDLLGRTILSQIIQPQGKQTEVDVSGLTNGIYFLTIPDENGSVEIRKFVKE